MKGFAFKQFVVQDDRCQMKVGTDGVLIGAWAGVEHTRTALDIGTGCGVIALMLAQRNSSLLIDGVELLASDATQASENVASSPWARRIKIHQTAIQDFESSLQYDLIVTNPPFFAGSSLPPDPRRATVRHAISLTHDELLTAVCRLLNPTGRFAIILPTPAYDRFTEEAATKGLYPCRILELSTRPGRLPERFMIEYSSAKTDPVVNSLVLYSGRHQPGRKDEWTEGYRRLVGDFYL